MIMISLIMPFVGLKPVLLSQLKEIIARPLDKPLEELLAKRKLARIETLRQAAQSYHPTEILEREIHRLLANKEKEK